MKSRHTILVGTLTVVGLLLAACGGDGGSADDAVDDTPTTEVPTGSEPEVDPSASGGLAEAIAGDVSWGWEPFRDRAAADPAEPELPQMQNVFLVGDEVWAEGRTDPPIGEDSEPVTAVIDPETREFETFETPGFDDVGVHDGMMWGFEAESRTISTFSPDAGASDPVAVPEIAAVLDATDDHRSVRFVSLSGGRLFIQVDWTMFELDTDDPGAVLDSLEIDRSVSGIGELGGVEAHAAGDKILYLFSGEDGFAAALSDGRPTAIDGDGPQAEVLGSTEKVVWHEGSDLIALDPVTGETETTSLTGAPTRVPSDAVQWDQSAVRHIGDDDNPALHIDGAPSGVVAATAKEDEVVLVDLSSGAKAAIGHLYGDLTGHRPLVVGDEVWLWSQDGQGIAILSFAPPSADGEGPDVVGETDEGDEGDDATPDEDVTDDPEYRSGYQQGRWAAESDLEDGWPADNDPDNYDPDASPEFKAGYIDGYDETYAGGDVDGETDEPDDPGAAAECEPGQSLDECYG